jgi:hypothetical protein
VAPDIIKGDVKGVKNRIAVTERSRRERNCLLETTIFSFAVLLD